MATVPPPPPPPEAESVKSLTKTAGLVTLIFGIIYMVIGAALIVTIFLAVFGIIPLVFGIMDILVYIYCNDIVRTIESGEYERAKEKTLTWMIIGFIIGGLIPGILLLVAYMKYDELLRHVR
jgi:uncharacterized membrane protein